MHCLFMFSLQFNFEMKFSIYKLEIDMHRDYSSKTSGILACFFFFLFGNFDVQVSPSWVKIKTLGGTYHQCMTAAKKLFIWSEMAR